MKHKNAAKTKTQIKAQEDTRNYYKYFRFVGAKLKHQRRRAEQMSSLPSLCHLCLSYVTSHGNMQIRLRRHAYTQVAFHR